MADPKGFLKTQERELPKRRPVPVRIMDWKEVYESQDPAQLRRQAGRCMDCGIPFCHQGCPLGNLIPEWNDLTWRNEGRQAIERLHATNNFPEFTGTTVPGTVRGELRARHQPARRDDQAGRGLDHRPGVRERVGDPASARAAHRQDRRRRRIGPRGSRRRAAADPRRPHGRRVRARRPHRRPAALRHPGLQDGEEAARGAPGSDAGRGHAVPRRRRTSASTSAGPTCGRDTTRC